VFGRAPAEHADVLRQMAFIAESQRYPDDFTPAHVFKAAPWFFENWDADFVERLVADFRLPVKRRIKKLSRGQLSAVGVIVGLASRAPLTFFDEPYLGLDAVARHIFYDRLLADYAEHPRTIVLSTHLIDEVANLLEHVILIDQGRILFDRDADELRGSATTVAGPRAAVDRFVADRAVIGSEGIGGLASVTIDGRLDQAERVQAAELGLELAPVSLQQLIVHMTGTNLGADSTEQEVAA
jgi:ABC-2 type transport system ATP-binding protein